MQFYGDLLRNMKKKDKNNFCEFFVKDCCVKAKNKSPNEATKRFFMICAVSANDGIKDFLEYNQIMFDSFFAERRYFSKIKKEIPTAVKSYISCMLILLSSNRELLRCKTGLTEEQLLYLWCEVFYYEESDRCLFDRFSRTIADNRDNVGLVFKELNELYHHKLSYQKNQVIMCTERNEQYLENLLANDVLVVIRRLNEYPDIN